MKAIGGYFELELPGGQPYHHEAIALNTGRNALEYILKANGFRKIFIPYYTCHVLLQPLKRLGIPYEYYSIDRDFKPLFDFGQLTAEDAFLYTNYYGLKDDFIRELSGVVPNLIIDNAQAFFAKPSAGVHAFYSTRKFFGVPDGGYAYTTQQLQEALPVDVSSERFQHLLIRAEQGAEKGYPFFVATDNALDDNPMRAMSVLSQKLLAGIPYEQYAETRRRNYQYMYDALRESNGIDLPLPAGSVPLVYPYLDNTNGVLRDKLIASRIYVARYWPEVLDLCAPGTPEHDYTLNLIPLPIDHRLSVSHLNTIIKTITQC